MADRSVTLAVTVRVTQHSVSVLPESSINHGSFEVTVDYRGGGRWAVKNRGFCLSATGEWDYESIPSEREDEWLADHRFHEETALRLAREAVQTITVNGWSVRKAMEVEGGRD